MVDNTSVTNIQEKSNAKMHKQLSPERVAVNRVEREMKKNALGKAKASPAADAERTSSAVSQVPSPINKTKFKTRHWLVLLSFVFFVTIPSGFVAGYLWFRAEDQYASSVGFSVRTEEVGSAIDSILGITQLSGSSSSDTDILYEFLQSQELVSEIDAELDLRVLWAKGKPEIDFWYAYDPSGTIEDLVEHWARKVKVSYDSSSGLIDIRVLAFAPNDAKAIATLISQKSTERINELSAIAREDAIRYAREELQLAENNLKQARLDLLEFRNRSQIIDPTLQTQSKSGLIAALESQLAEAQIELLLLQQNTRSSDTRIQQTELKIDVIRQQIADERNTIGLNQGDQEQASVAELVGEFEELSVELEFAQQAYSASRAAFDSASNEARRQSRYLANHIAPTLAEKSQYPQRFLNWSLITLFIAMSWSVVVLVAFALKDRR